MKIKYHKTSAEDSGYILAFNDREFKITKENLKELYDWKNEEDG